MYQRTRQCAILAVFLFLSIAFFAAAQWAEPGTRGDVDSPLVATAEPQTKAGRIDVNDVFVKSFANFNDEGEHFRRRGEFLSVILRGAGGAFRSLAPGGRRTVTPQVGSANVYNLAEAQCNPGEVLVSCFGSRDAEMAMGPDSCGNESGCRYLGTEPFDQWGNPASSSLFVPPAVGCRSGLLYQRRNMEPVAIAFCARLEPR